VVVVVVLHNHQQQKQKLEGDVVFSLATKVYGVCNSLMWSHKLSIFILVHILSVGLEGTDGVITI
jgi:hypothetical protein